MCPNFSIPIHSRNPDSRTNRKEEKVPLDAMIVFRRRSKRSPRRPLARIFADRASSRMKPLSPAPSIVGSVDGDDDDDDDDEYDSEDEPCRPSLAPKREVKRVGLKKIPPRYIVHSSDDDDDDHDSEDEDDPYMKRLLRILSSSAE
mmetsp:Transcript_32063/g.54307  ORF Transcript_32063/g.54307 Transcript_32063/m.54307 type:complete len:146 (+) Transcript_32063:2131-2568(+)